jgi:hypothetical protein
MLTTEPSKELQGLIAEAARRIGYQIQLARYYVGDSLTFQRLKEDQGRGYLLGASDWLRDLVNVPAAEREYALPLLYASVISDLATAVEILGKRVADRWNAACEESARRATAEIKDAIQKGIEPRGLATFLRYGNADAHWEPPPPGKGH